MEIRVGKTYKVNHRRKGKFVMRVTEVDPIWVTGVIVEGRTKAIIDYNTRDTGDTITVLVSFCVFNEIPEPSAPQMVKELQAQLAEANERADKAAQDGWLKTAETQLARAKKAEAQLDAVRDEYLNHVKATKSPVMILDAIDWILEDKP